MSRGDDQKDLEAQTEKERHVDLGTEAVMVSSMPKTAWTGSDSDDDDDSKR